MFNIFSCKHKSQYFFSSLNSNLLDMRNLEEQVKKAYCYQNFEWIVLVHDLKNFANSWPSDSNFKSFSRSLEQFFLMVGKNNFGNKILVPALKTKRKALQICILQGWHIDIIHISNNMKCSFIFYENKIICVCHNWIDLHST